MNPALKTLSISDVVEATGMDRDMVYRLVSSGAVNAAKVGRNWRVQEISLLAWIETSQATPAPVGDDDQGAQFGLTKDEQVFN